MLGLAFRRDQTIHQLQELVRSNNLLVVLQSIERFILE
jgi:hypothetical protein